MKNKTIGYIIVILLIVGLFYSGKNSFDSESVIINNTVIKEVPIEKIVYTYVSNLGCPTDNFCDYNNTKINFDKTYAIGGYFFTFTNSPCQASLAYFNLTDCAGWTYENGSVYIRQGNRLKDVMVYCNHEVCHNQLNIDLGIEQVVCSTLDVYLAEPVCTKLKEQLIMDIRKG